MYSAKAKCAPAKPSVVLRYTPYNRVRETNLVINDGYRSQKLAPVPADMIPIESEEVHRTGSVLRRDLTFEEVHLTSSPAPTSLRDCITYGFLNMFNASRFICSLKKKGSFSEGSYQTDIHVTKMGNFDKKILAHTPEPCGHEYMGISFSASNFTRNWVLSAEKPFLNVDLVASAMEWVPKPRDNKYIMEPPNSIKQYAIRANGRNGRVDKLKNVPDLVESTLLDCAKDMLGSGREELNLGKDDDERCITFEHLLLERSMWRKQLLKVLQRALNDIRCQKFDI